MIFFWPDYRKGNPYQQSLYTCISAKNARCEPITNALDFLRAAPSQTVFFHLHWTHWIFESAENEHKFEELTVDFMRKVDQFRALGGIFVWTVHNAGNHESIYVDLERKFHEELARRVDLLLLHEKSSIAIVRREFRLIESRVRILPHGNYVGTYPNTSSKSEARKKLDLSSQKRLFGLVGMLRPYKGVEEFIAAVDKINEKAHRINAFIAGKRISPYKHGDIKNMVKGILGLLVEEKFIPEEKLHYYLNAADFIVLPYRRILTSGSVLLAASFARPVLLPRLESFEDLFDLPFVFTYEPEDVDDMATKMLELGGLDSAELDRLSQAALDWAKTRDWQTISKQLNTYLDEIRQVREPADVHISEGEVDHRVQVYNQEDNGQLYDIALCVVNYRSIGDLRKLQRSLQKHVKVRWRMLILDNSEQELEFAQLKKDFPDAVLVKPEENLGYAAGNNVLMAMAKKAGFPVIGILKPDITLREDCITDMVEAVAAQPDTMHSPAILQRKKEGELSISFFNSNISRVAGALSIKHELTGQSLGSLPKEKQESDSLCGCAMFFGSQIVEKYGYMPEEYFLYFEETDWTYGLKCKGVTLFAHPNTSIIHAKTSHDNGLPTLAYGYYLSRGALLFARKYGFNVRKTASRHMGTFVRHWCNIVEETSPIYAAVFRQLCKAGLADGRQKVHGPVDILVRLAENSGPYFRRSQGFLECVDLKTGNLHGWAGEKWFFLPRTPRLAIFVDNFFVGDVEPTINRPDIKALGFSVKAGFHYKLQNLSQMQETRVDVLNACTCQPLFATKAVFQKDATRKR